MWSRRQVLVGASALSAAPFVSACEPDLTRRCPIVDPDDHHLFVSLGCAAENLVQAALAHGFTADGQLATPAKPTS